MNISPVYCPANHRDFSPTPVNVIPPRQKQPLRIVIHPPTTC
ncbi:hypothetical protein C7S15_1225 [Burkholderia cepacia]|nr:hypothetical protein [Burkholderia cepacia]